MGGERVQGFEWRSTNKRVHSPNTLTTLCEASSPEPSTREVPDLARPPRLLALDCEMCSTSSSPRELLFVSLVDERGAPLLETLVQPQGTILDLKTSLTGITAKQLEARNGRGRRGCVWQGAEASCESAGELTRAMRRA